MRNIMMLSSLGLLGACAYTEDALTHVDLFGKVRIPEAAVTMTLVDDSGTEREVSDPRLLGPVFLGAYASVQDGHYAFAHPEMGPVLDPDGETPGNAYPYGGTTIGRFGWGCYQGLVCKVVTGRYESYGDVLDFFKTVVEKPVLDNEGNEVTDAMVYQEQCFEQLHATSDDEIDFIENGARDFELVDGFYEAEVEMLHVDFSPGLAVWGWTDMPSQTFSFATCDENIGEYANNYSDQYYKGTNINNLLNYPGLRIDEGDWVSSVEDSPVITDPNDDFVVDLSFHYED